jgi:hypothetical protein
LLLLWSCPGLPDFSWHKIPKQRKFYRIATKLPNGHKIGIPNGNNMLQMSIEYTNLSIPRHSNISTNKDFWMENTCTI